MLNLHPDKTRASQSTYGWTPAPQYFISELFANMDIAQLPAELMHYDEFCGFEL